MVAVSFGPVELTSETVADQSRFWLNHDYYMVGKRLARKFAFQFMKNKWDDGVIQQKERLARKTNSSFKL